MLIDKLSMGLQGIGAANCPSVEQLQGVQDCSDPCQAGNPPCTTAPLSSAPLQPGFCIDGTTGITVPCSSLASSNLSLNQAANLPAPVAPAFGIPPSLIAVGAGVFLIVLILAGARR